ncbi:hypothetical protein DL98DRAFT_566715 [Cadophora sp. DSE1049]|nr:hypothetical protein DL98DRAFT_566715 [Cadophora sp. DSE1049]
MCTTYGPMYQPHGNPSSQRMESFIVPGEYRKTGNGKYLALYQYTIRHNTMDLSHSLIDAIAKSSFVFADEALRSALAKQHASAPLPRVSSSLGGNLDTSKWRIDGATLCGTQFYAVPVCLLPDLAPRRIDVFIPDQQYHPTELLDALQSSLAVCLRDGRDIAALGISRHICAALDHHCESNPRFLDEYRRLPFGSKLIFEEIKADIREMPLSIVPAHSLEQQTRSVASLKISWSDVADSNWPESIDINSLMLKRELQDSVSVVGILDGRHGINEEYIFKSNASEFRCLYHELHLLLACPPHPNIMPRPLYLVTKKSNFGGKRGVYGFILPLLPQGSIRDLLPSRTISQTLPLEEQFAWAQQVTSALIHINEKGGTFYSDLRPDNVLLSTLGSGTERIVLCDFEQRGNWHEWCAPEVLYRVYIENLRVNATTTSHPWEDLVSGYSTGASDGIDADTWIETHVPHGRNPVWFAMSASKQESAQVYSLGLLIYCIFEGLSNVKINIVNSWPHDPDIEFPEFRRSPLAIRDLVKRCTRGAREWNTSGDPSDRPSPVRRIAGKLYPSVQMQTRFGDERLNEAVVETARVWWESQLEDARDFLRCEATGKWRAERPSLNEVLAALEDPALCSI